MKTAWCMTMAALLALPLDGGGSWGPVRCPPVGGPRAAAQVPYQAPLPAGWHWSLSYPGWAFQTVDGTFSGPLIRWWEPATGRTVAHTPPKPQIVDPGASQGPLRPSPEVKEERELNFGVDPEQVAASPRGYTDRGEPVSRDEALDRVLGSTFDDDSALPRVTIFGSPELCRKVEEDIANDPRLAALRKAALVKSFHPGDWYFKEVGVESCEKWKGFLLLFSQRDKDGQRVEHAQWSYDGPADLEKAVAAWDPTKAPDLRKPEPVITPAIEEWVRANWVLLAAVAVIGYLIYQKKE